MSKQPQSQSDLSEHLADHIDFLQVSADSYDKGFTGESKRLAVSIRVLVHDTKNAKSLLGQLGKKYFLEYNDSSFPIIPGNLSSHFGLVVMTSSLRNGGAGYRAFLDHSPMSGSKTLSFDQWWELPVFFDLNGNQMSRKDIVLSVADQDGGAHVDPVLNQKYADLSRNNSLGWVYSDGTTSKTLEGPERAAVRQIAHELLKTLIPGYSKMPKLKNGEVLMGGSSVIIQDPPEISSRPFQTKKIKVGRNDPCPCGSNKKYKRCCGNSI